MEETYKVYALVDEAGRICKINSSAFLSDLEGWTLIDEGYDDKYHHAQGNYFPKGLMDERGILRYKLLGGKPVERTQEEMDADWVEPEVVPTHDERLTKLEATLSKFVTLLGEKLGIKLE